MIFKKMLFWQISLVPSLKTTRSKMTQDDATTVVLEGVAY